MKVLTKFLNSQHLETTMVITLSILDMIMIVTILTPYHAKDRLLGNGLRWR
jgi:hypothetical protein